MVSDASSGHISIALLQRARLRYRVLNCVILLVFLSNAIGCGSNRNAAGTPSGAYTLTIQATSGSTVQNAKLTLVVK